MPFSNALRLSSLHLANPKPETRNRSYPKPFLVEPLRYYRGLHIFKLISTTPGENFRPFKTNRIDGQTNRFKVIQIESSERTHPISNLCGAAVSGGASDKISR